MPRDDSFKERMEEAKPLLDSVVDCLWHEAAQRVANDSYGEMTIMLKWEKGALKCCKFGGDNVIMPRRPGKLPGSGVDQP